MQMLKGMDECKEVGGIIIRTCDLSLTTGCGFGSGSASFSLPPASMDSYEESDLTRLV